MGKIAGGFVVLAMFLGGTVTADTARPKVRGKSATVMESKSARIGDFSITFSTANHKHADDGETLGMWTFVVKKGRAGREIQIRSDEAHFEAELVVHGAAFVFRHIDYETFAITLVANMAAKPLGEEACADKITAAAKKAGYPESASRGYSNDEGIVVLRAEGWRGFCGTLTKRVWIEPTAKVGE